MPRKRAPLTIEMILGWADHHHDETGNWPRANNGYILAAPIERWGRINCALYQGHRGLPGGDTLHRLLAREREVRMLRAVPMLTEDLIVSWAQVHFERNRKWPRAEYDPVFGADGEEWSGIDGCLRGGHRGLPGGDSLAKLLARRLGVRNRTNQPPLTIEEILVWADSYHVITGNWPARSSGVEGLPEGEAWTVIDSSLRAGRRGLPGGSSLARLLREQREVQRGLVEKG